MGRFGGIVMTGPGKTRRALVGLGLVLAASFGTSGFATASPCGTRSPLLEALGDDYPLLGDRVSTISHAAHRHPSSRHEPGQVVERLRSSHRGTRLSTTLERLHSMDLEGGEGERVRCRGTGVRQREVIWLFDLEQLERVSTADGRTTINAFEFRHTLIADPVDDRLVAGSLVAETLEIPPLALWRQGSDASTLRANRRFRRHGSPGSSACALARSPSSTIVVRAAPKPAPHAALCGRVTEIDTTLRVLAGSVELEQVLYVDGLWSERVRWRIDS